jgi:hypothetical protein
LIGELKKDFFGSLQNEDGREFCIALFLHDTNCHITNGITASKFFGIQEATQVVRTYENYDNRFRLAIESFAGNDLPDDAHQSLESVNSRWDDESSS